MQGDQRPDCAHHTSGPSREQARRRSSSCFFEGCHPLREDDFVVEVAFEGFRGPPEPVLLDDALHHSGVEQVSRPSSVHAVRGEQSW
eukprot:2569267-Rhodomonas_salina.1